MRILGDSDCFLGCRALEKSVVLEELFSVSPSAYALVECSGIQPLPLAQSPSAVLVTSMPLCHSTTLDQWLQPCKKS